MTELLSTILKGKCILAIDDEPDSLEVIKLLLEMYGARVVTATDGMEGLVVAVKEQPTFIISDLSMPNMNGWEFVDQIKRNRRTLDIPVVALTAHAMRGDREKAIAAGFHNYLTKPLIPETFNTELLRVVLETPAISMKVA